MITLSRLFSVTLGLILVCVLAFTVFPSATVWAQETVVEQIEAIMKRIEALEEKVASESIPPVTLEPGPDGFFSSGKGNWTGKILIEDPGVRLFQVTLKEDECGTVEMAHQGGNTSERIYYACFQPYTPAVGGKIMDFQDISSETDHDETYPLGEYAISVDSKGEWEILVLGGASAVEQE